MQELEFGVDHGRVTAGGEESLMAIDRCGQSFINEKVGLMASFDVVQFDDSSLHQ